MKTKETRSQSKYTVTEKGLFAYFHSSLILMSTSVKVGFERKRYAFLSKYNKDLKRFESTKVMLFYLKIFLNIEYNHKK